MKAELNTKNYNDNMDLFYAEFEDLEKLSKRISKMYDFKEKICKAKKCITMKGAVYDLKLFLNYLDLEDKNLLMSIAHIANSDKEFSEIFLIMQEDKFKYLDIIKLKEKELEKEQIHIYNQFIVFNYNRLNYKNSISDLTKMSSFFLSGSLEDDMDYIRIQVDSFFSAYLRLMFPKYFS